jgi:hypothetical protein
MCEAIEDFDDIKKVGQDFTSADPKKWILEMVQFPGRPL